MASQSNSGLATDLARQVADRAHDLSSRVDGREPRELLDDVRSFARRKPGVFLLGAALAGVVAGRLTTGVVAAHKDSSPSTGGQQLTGTGSPYTSESYATGTNYIADTQSTGYAGTTGYETGTTGYATTGTTGSVPPPPYGTVPPEGTSVPPTTTAGWDDPARTPGSGQL
jgi:hypothetical protein